MAMSRRLLVLVLSLGAMAGAKSPKRNLAIVVYGCGACSYSLVSEGRKITATKSVPFPNAPVVAHTFRFSAATRKYAIEACSGDSCYTIRKYDCEMSGDTCRASYTLMPDLDFRRER